MNQMHRYIIKSNINLARGYTLDARAGYEVRQAYRDSQLKCLPDELAEKILSCAIVTKNQARQDAERCSRIAMEYLNVAIEAARREREAA